MILQSNAILVCLSKFIQMRGLRMRCLGVKYLAGKTETCRARFWRLESDAIACSSWITRLLFQRQRFEAPLSRVVGFHGRVCLEPPWSFGVH